MTDLFLKEEETSRKVRERSQHMSRKQVLEYVPLVNQKCSEEFNATIGVCLKSKAALTQCRGKFYNSYLFFVEYISDLSIPLLLHF